MEIWFIGSFVMLALMVLSAALALFFRRADLIWNEYQKQHNEGFPPIAFQVTFMNYTFCSFFYHIYSKVQGGTG